MIKQRFGAIVLSLGLLTGQLMAQNPFPAKSAAEIQHEMKKLLVLGSVLYVAAHPDDENQRMIGYYAQGKGYQTAYLSLTRGDGGQNLIGEEKGYALGMLRTQELLAARRIDGGRQMFSRAYDFGYSKTPAETFATWEDEKVLADVVWAIRKHRPDIIITRFPGPEKGGGGHGHHTASAMLAQKAFGMSNDTTVFPEQFKYVKPWQAKRLFWNAGRWRGIKQEYIDASLQVETGVYDPLLGKTYAEIASEARSQHRCQGFGAAIARGSREELLYQELGEKAESYPMEGINTSWSRIEGGAAIGEHLQKIYDAYQPQDPAASVPELLKVYQKLALYNDYWSIRKREDLKKVILYCAGVWMDVTSNRPIVAQGDSVLLTTSIVNRSDYPLIVEGVSYGIGLPFQIYTQSLEKEDGLKRFDYKIKVSSPVSQPYWLRTRPAKGIFHVDNQSLIGLPENPPISAGVSLNFMGVQIPYTVPINYRYVDRARGEIYRPFTVAPKTTANFSDPSFLFASGEPQQVGIVVKHFGEKGQVKMHIKAPPGWVISQETHELTFERSGEEQRILVEVTPPATQSQGFLQAFAEQEGQLTNYSQQEIAYDHIPAQMLFQPAEARLIRVELEKKGQKIGYLMGSGDEIPACLAQVGYSVDLLEDDQVTLENLRQYDAIIAGIRAYNTRPRMPYLQKNILEYVKSGGTYIVQYNTSRGMGNAQLGPYPFTLSRDRVSEEDASVKFLLPDHPALNTPNKITQADFEGWVQERGLYFPNKWDDKFQALLEWNDTGEDPKKGGLLVAEYGEGHYVYSGISWFRELPAGVPGAYRLFVNLLSLGN
ncbi:MAG: PIG-L family deacetylase [Bacteroidota bacterium]